MIETFQVDREAIGYIAPALEVVQSVCREVQVEFFVIGAAARDLLLEQVYGATPLRATQDVDVAVAVEGWTEYEAVLAQFVDAHGFRRSSEPHRVRRNDIIVDLVPFGRIAAGQSQIEWPNGTTEMSILGYQEAYDAGVGISIGGDPVVRVASLPGLGVLKMIAWNEAPYKRPQDPIDLCTIMMQYEHVVGERLYNDHADLLDDHDFDVKVAASRIYGREVAPLLLNHAVRDQILKLLVDNTEDEYDSKLVTAMGSACHRDYAFRLRCLKAFMQGIRDYLAH